MKIDAISLERIIWMLYDRYFDFQEIILKKVEIDIDHYIHGQLLVQYYHMETIVKLIARIRVEDDIIIDTKGTIKYGFIYFDFNKILKEYLNQNRYLTVNDESIIIKNEWIENMKIEDKNIVVELKNKQGV